MDQLKVALQAIKKHHFWILCGVIVVLVLVVWWSATSGLAGLIETRRGELEGTMSKVQGIATESLHANQAVVKGIQGQQGDLTDGVVDAWKFFYDQQEQQTQWPDLGYKFREYMDQVGPDAKIPDPFLDLYMNTIQDHYPAAFYDIVDIRLPGKLDETGKPVLDENGKPEKVDPFADLRGTRGYSGSGMDEGMTMPGMGQYDGSAYDGMRTTGKGNLIGLVDWNPADLKRIRGMLHWAKRPTSMEVRLAQEDLWVYEALARIIAATNEGSTSYYNAAVKRIDALDIGRRAASAFAQSRGAQIRAGFGSGMSGYPGEEMMMSGDYMEEMDEMATSGMMPGSDASGMMPGSSTDAMYPGAAPGAASLSAEERMKAALLENRYVDQAGMPLSATETTVGEFKMMPIRMLLLVDQRRIFRLLVNCANSGMPVEVKKVALSPGKGSLDFARLGSSLGTYGGSGSYDEERSGMMPYMGGAMGGTGMMPGDTMPGNTMYEEQGAGMGMSGTMSPSQRGGQQTSYDIPIEIQGIIYMFNRPDSEKLGVTAPGQGAGAEPAAPPVPGGPNNP